MKYMERATDRNSRFLTREFQRAMIPVMTAVLGGTINAIIDSMFVTRRLDSDALSAVTYSMPVFLVLCMVGCLFGIGSSILASKAIGKHDVEEASRYFHSMLFLSIITGLIFSLIGIFLEGPVASLLCSDVSLLDQVESYAGITLIGAPFYILIYVPNYYLQLDGKGRSLTKMMVIMIITDIGLDYLLLYVFDMGIAGASLASVLSIAVACVCGIIPLCAPGGMFRPRLKNLRPYDVRNIVRYGSTSAMGSLMSVFRLYGLNRIIYAASGNTGMKIWSVINALSELSLCILAGIPRTALPLLGICSAGHDNEGMRLIIKHEFRIGLILSLAFTAALAALSVPIRVFYKIDVPLLLPLLALGISVIPELFSSILSSFYNVSGRPLMANLAMVFRILVFPVGTAFILMAAGLPVFLFLPVGMILAALSLLMISRCRSYKTRGTEHELSSVLLLDDHLQRNGMVKGFSIESTDEEICHASEVITEFCTDHEMDSKLAMKLGLSLEELMTVMVRKSSPQSDDPVDIRVYSTKEFFGLSIMCFGRKYNPFESEDEDDEMNMGILMIKKMSKNYKYLYSMGMNILSVEF